jgi:uncharacterized protein YbjT (DUF2867 family)
MKIAVIGGSGLIGRMVVQRLRHDGHQVISASPSSGVDTLTGEGLEQALAGTDVVVDVSNSPSFEREAVLAFFTTSAQNIARAETAAGVGHHVLLSVVGTDRLPDNGYFQAKLAQERLVREAGIPFSILHATQFFEFIGSIAQPEADGTIRLSPALFQPVAAADVAAELASMATSPPLNGMVELAGGDVLPLDEIARRYLSATGKVGRVISDAHARYFGAELDDQSLLPGAAFRTGPTRLKDWLAKQSDFARLTN